MKHYMFLMSLGWFAVIFNASLFVFNVFHGADIDKLLCNSLSSLAVLLAMYSYCMYDKAARRCRKAAMQLINSHETKFDYENTVGIYYISEFSDKFVIYKKNEFGLNDFIVRTFPYDKDNDESRKKARLRAYSLLNHITDNGKLWRGESK